MKIALSLLITLSLGTVIQCSTTNFLDDYHPTYIVRIKIPDRESIPAIPCLYHGSALMCKDGFCQLPEKTLRTFFSIIITPRVEFACTGSTKIMKRLKNQPCKWYNLTLRLEESLKDKKPTYKWDIEEINPKNMPLRLPEDASIVFELPPTFIHKLEHPQKTGPFTVKLPTVVIKKSITNEQLEKALVDMAAYAPERNKNCTKPTDFWQKNGKTILLKKQVP
jgi:hypothetical protein